MTTTAWNGTTTKTVVQIYAEGAVRINDAAFLDDLELVLAKIVAR